MLIAGELEQIAALIAAAAMAARSLPDGRPVRAILDIVEAKLRGVMAGLVGGE